MSRKLSLLLHLLKRQSDSRPVIRSAVKEANRGALLALIAANTIPIILAVIFGWSIGNVVFFYWWENVIIGLFALLRIVTASGGGLPLPAGRFALVPFFIFHYFFFCFVHLVFLRVFFADNGFSGGSSISSAISNLWETIPAGGLAALAVLLASHGISYCTNYIAGGEYRHSHPMIEMFRPYGRIVVLHVCIIFGGIAVQFFDSPILMIVLLMTGKTILDVISHSIMHAFSRARESKSLGDQFVH